MTPSLVSVPSSLQWPKFQQLLGLSWVSCESPNKWCDCQPRRGTCPLLHYLSQIPLHSRYHSGPVKKERLVIVSEVEIRDSPTSIKVLGTPVLPWAFLIHRIKVRV